MARRVAGALGPLLLALTALAIPCAGLGADEFAAEGTWFVLVHYRDRSADHPEQLRWEDRIWVFERDGAALKWTEYPIVVFQDDSGRFERLGTNRASRVVGAWEPDAAQLEQIRSGLEFNTRGAKTKTLRGSDAAGWRSSGSAAPTSANVIGYSETWSIADVAAAPVFTRIDVLGSASSQAMEGKTEYRTESIAAGGAELRGSFARDGVRHGQFRMLRSGTPSIVKGSGKTQSERMREAFLSRFGEDLGLASAEDREEYERAIRDKSTSPEVWNGVRADVRKQVEARVRADGGDVKELAPEIDRVTDRIVALMREGRSLQEIDQILRQDALAP